ncbi:MAG: hypothetical protein Q4F79_07270 [Eubacteriales bacterium]|nr:hypothetical protein [Eubacteriales bacterium]
MNAQNLVSVGIIGGADGPTEIYVTSSPLGNLVAAVGIVCVAVLVVCAVRRHKKRQD